MTLDDEDIAALRWLLSYVNLKMPPGAGSISGVPIGASRAYSAARYFETRLKAAPIIDPTTEPYWARVEYEAARRGDADGARKAHRMRWEILGKELEQMYKET
jgi:hypothetical protein